MFLGIGKVLAHVFGGRCAGSYAAEAQIRAQRSHWQCVFGQLGFDWHRKFRPSQQSLAQSAADAPGDIPHWADEVREQFLMDTSGVLAILLFWCVQRRRQDERRRADLLLLGCFWRLRLRSMSSLVSTWQPWREGWMRCVLPHSRMALAVTWWVGSGIAPLRLEGGWRTA